MSGNTIRLFMWGYQSHFRAVVEHTANEVLRQIGIRERARSLLVGIRRPNVEDRHAVCIEPEDDLWPEELFADLPTLVEATVKTNPLKDMFYTDERATREKPENIRRDSIARSIREILAGGEAESGVVSWVAPARPVGNFHVSVVLQAPCAVFQRFARLQHPASDEHGPVRPRSFIDAAMNGVLDEATKELETAEPGRELNGTSRSAAEIVRLAARNFMMTLGWAVGGRFGFHNLFDQLNLISSLYYEKESGTGRMILVKRESKDVEYHVRLREPVALREHRWARKALQLASQRMPLIADSENLYGLGCLVSSYKETDERAYVVDFVDHYTWEARCGDALLLRCRYGVPTLGSTLMTEEEFCENFRRVFPSAEPGGGHRLFQLYSVAVKQEHGSMIAVDEDAASEAERLAQQGTPVEPTPLTVDLFEQLSRIDGTIIVDPEAKVHAIGVILDGPAHPRCTPSRGSRYNSGVRFVGDRIKGRLAIVVSDDRTVDVLPVLRPRVRRSQIESAITLLESANLGDYHKPRNWIDEHRFYFDEGQCARVNAALERIEKLPNREGSMVIITERLTPDPDMSDEFIEEESG